MNVDQEALSELPSRSLALDVGDTAASSHSCVPPTVFQQIDIEEHVQAGKGPQIRAFGVTQVCDVCGCSMSPRSADSTSQAGHSVLLHISGFLPYFWVAAPKDFTNADCAPLMEHLNVS